MHLFKTHKAFILFSAVFLLICAVPLDRYVQLPLLALVFGVLVYLQLEHKDRNLPHVHTRMMLGNKYTLHVSEVSDALIDAPDTYTGKTINLGE